MSEQKPAHFALSGTREIPFQLNYSVINRPVHRGFEGVCSNPLLL